MDAYSVPVFHSWITAWPRWREAIDERCQQAGGDGFEL